MSSMVVKRCTHCVQPLVAVPVDGGPMLVCRECDLWDPLLSPAAGE